MKIIKSFKYIYLSIVLFVFSFNFSALSVSATVPASKVVISHDLAITSTALDWIYTTFDKTFYIEDSSDFASLLPSGSTTFFIKTGDDTFNFIDSSELLTLVLNRGIGIILNPNSLDTLLAGYLTEIGTYTGTYNGDTFPCAALYNSQGYNLGYCIDDITGCHYEGISTTITVPSNTVNNVYNYYNYYYGGNCDYFILNGYGISNGISLCSLYSSETSSAFLSYYESLAPYCSFNFCLSGSSYSFASSSFEYDAGSVFYCSDPSCFVSTDSSSFNGLVNTYNLSTGDSLNASVFLTSPSVGLSADCYTNGNKSNSFSWFRVNYAGNVSIGQTSSSIYFGNPGFPNNFYTLADGSVIVYKDLNTYNSVVNNTYNFNEFYSNIYYQFNINTDNSFDYTYSLIDNSVNNNSTLYNDVNNDIYDYFDNGVYDYSYSEVINQTIINTYPDPVPDDPDDPDNPDNPDDPDSSILDTLLQKIVEFLEAIGAVIAAVISGVLGLFTNVIEALSGITDLIGSVGSFIGSIFNFLPSDLVTVLVAAISLCILAAVIKFIRG